MYCMNKDIFISQCLNYDLVHAMPLITIFLERGFVDNLYIVYVMKYILYMCQVFLMISWIPSVQGIKEFQVIVFVIFTLGQFINVCLCPCSRSLYCFNQLDGSVFLWQIAVSLNWFLNTFLAKKRQEISFPLLSYVSNKPGGFLHNDLKSNNIALDNRLREKCPHERCQRTKIIFSGTPPEICDWISSHRNRNCQRSERAKHCQWHF